MSFLKMRNVKLSMFHEIKTHILPYFGYIEAVAGEILTESSGTVYTFANNNIAYADASGYLAPSGVTIYDDGVALSNSVFTVNYVTNIVTLDTTPSGAVTADYNFWPVTVLDAFPEGEDFENADLPLVVIDLDSQEDSPYAIGVSSSFWSVGFFIDVFAPNDGMRYDLTDYIQKGMRYAMLYVDFGLAMPLNYDGTMNTDFNLADQTEATLKLPTKTRAKFLNLGEISPKEKYRSSITGILTFIS